MLTVLWNLLRQWTGALAAEKALEQAHDLRARELEEKDHLAMRFGGLERRHREALDLVRKAEMAHLQDEARLAEAAAQRWAAVSALIGGVEQLQQKWLDEADPLPASDPRRACVNELGGLKRSIQKQFGVHPSQAKKSAAYLGLGGELRGAIEHSYDVVDPYDDPNFATGGRRALPGAGKPTLKEY